MRSEWRGMVEQGPARRIRGWRGGSGAPASPRAPAHQGQHAQQEGGRAHFGSNLKRYRSFTSSGVSRSAAECINLEIIGHAPGVSRWENRVALDREGPGCWFARQRLGCAVFVEDVNRLSIVTNVHVKPRHHEIHGEGIAVRSRHVQRQINASGDQHAAVSECTHRASRLACGLFLRLGQERSDRPGPGKLVLGCRAARMTGRGSDERAIVRILHDNVEILIHPIAVNQDSQVPPRNGDFVGSRDRASRKDCGQDAPGDQRMPAAGNFGDA